MQFLVMQAKKGLSNVILENISFLPQRPRKNFCSLHLYHYTIL